MQHLLKDPAAIDRILEEGAARANAIAEGTLREVYEIVGFRFSATNRPH
jgi:tryptophanyl-tRNA synthetase